jgi:hypothetical protein
VKISRMVLLSTLACLAACTSVRVHPVDPAAQMQHVCIQENPKVLVDDFVMVLREGFERHGISTQVFPTGSRPAGCEFVLTYTALRSWDLAPYLTHAELRIEKAGRVVASAQYHLRGDGGFSLAKWAGTKFKMDPVIDELLTGSPSASLASTSPEDIAPRVPAVDTIVHAEKAGEGTAEARLRELQHLKDQGLITEQEYNERRRAIVNQI